MRLLEAVAIFNDFGTVNALKHGISLLRSGSPRVPPTFQRITQSFHAICANNPPHCSIRRRSPSISRFRRLTVGPRKTPIFVEIVA
jgi:hypothetical protein